MKSRSTSAMLRSENMEYIENPYQVRDYQMITKHLREKVHLDKLQGRRVRKGKSGSTTSLQQRGLHNYPMQYNREDIRSAKWSSDGRRESSVKMNRSKVDSCNLKNHSKDMFDYAVKTVPPKPDRAVQQGAILVQDDREKQRSRTLSVDIDVTPACSTRSTRTGPTKDGSALYNNRARVLNSIRTRPHTDTGCRFNHERASCTPNIRDAMSLKSDMFDVLELNPRQRASSSSSTASTNLILIPRTQGSVYSDLPDGETHYRPSTVEDFLNDPDVFDSSTTHDGSADGWTDRERTPSVVRRGNDSGSYLLPPSTPCSINLVTLDEETSTSSEEEEENAAVQQSSSPPHPKAEQAPHPTPKKGKAAAHEPEVVEEPQPPPKLVLKGPHCWVDDASVTSSHPEPEELEQLEQLEQDRQGILTDTHGAKHEDAGHNVKIVDNKQPAMDCPDGVKVETIAEPQECIVENGVAHVEEVDCFEDNLPPFLCPSSEQKSRQAAIKDWLCSSNNIFSYPRTVPML